MAMLNVHSEGVTTLQEPTPPSSSLSPSRRRPPGRTTSNEQPATPATRGPIVSQLNDEIGNGEIENGERASSGVLSSSGLSRDIVNGGAAVGDRYRDRENATSSTKEETTTTASYKNPWCSCFIRISLLLILPMAIICSTMAALSCQFFTLKDLAFDENEQWSSILPAVPPPPPGDSTENAMVTTGLFSHGAWRSTDKKDSLSRHDFLDLSQCTPYTENNSHDNKNRFWTVKEHGAFFVTAQWASLIAPCLGALVWICHLYITVRWVSTLGRNHTTIAALQNNNNDGKGNDRKKRDQRQHDLTFRRNFFCLVILHLLATLVQGYTFAIYADMDFCLGVSDQVCELGYAGYASVAAIMLYYTSLVLLCFLPRPYHGQVESAAASKKTSRPQQNATNHSLRSYSREEAPPSPSMDSRSVHFEENTRMSSDDGDRSLNIFRLPGRGNYRSPAMSRSIHTSSNDSSILSYLSSDHKPMVQRREGFRESQQPPESILEGP